MKKYLVFAGRNYYPNGGFEDFQDSFDNLQDVIKNITETTCDWAHVVDIETGKQIYAMGRI